MSPHLPQTPGLLPTFLLINALLSFYSVFMCFFLPSQARTMYLGPARSQFTPLSRRTFGGWSLLSGCVRFYAAYHISNPEVYALAFWAYVAIGIHWFTELVVFGTVGWGGTSVGSLGTECVGLGWMWWQWEAYTGSL